MGKTIKTACRESFLLFTCNDETVFCRAIGGYCTTASRQKSTNKNNFRYSKWRTKTAINGLREPSVRWFERGLQGKSNFGIVETDERHYTLLRL
jgi:hypothetical protein